MLYRHCMDVLLRPYNCEEVQGETNDRCLKQTLGLLTATVFHLLENVHCSIHGVPSPTIVVLSLLARRPFFRSKTLQTPNIPKLLLGFSPLSCAKSSKHSPVKSRMIAILDDLGNTHIYAYQIGIYQPSRVNTHDSTKYLKSSHAHNSCL
jgi:hypothetical protein